ncbi:hook-length control protein FliK [Sporobacter termitidis DSM 10068]|uniref:Hook-length control protein FliK n=1 Tax=Sporobacter termitidis DSM 10068 TaxID=1123282 RepID=A0A1M5W8A9_9FIRM|nr:flagellar hook-length control protein FliK [Sporobacter termitidis]SHH83726.1 hook-length control protein FliK [Sporobacter termitidis DSM 10068]
MQATSLIIMPAAANTVDPAGEASSSGQGIRVNSANQKKSRDSLFTAILQKGIKRNAPSGLSSGNVSGTGDADRTGEKEADDASDVCSLLMQLLVMNVAPAPTSAGGAQAGEEGDSRASTGPDGLVTDIGGPGGLLATGDLLQQSAAFLAALPQDDAAKAAEILKALTAGDSGDGGIQNGTDVAAALAGITEALKENLPQKTPDLTQNLSNFVQNTSEPDGQAASDIATIDATAPAPPEASDGAPADPRLTAAPAGVRQTGARTAEVRSGTDPSGRLAAMQDAAPTAENVKAVESTAAGGESENGAELGARDKSKADETDSTGTATQQVTAGASFKGETAAEKTAAVEKALNRFAEDLRGFQGGPQEIKIVLQPESLGTLTISVTKTETGITAKIKAEDREIVAAISDQLQKLVSSMESKGIRLTNVDVVYSQTEQNTGFGQQHFDRGRDDTPKGFTFTPGKYQDSDANGADFWQEYYGGETSGDATVDYRI